MSMTSPQTVEQLRASLAALAGLARSQARAMPAGYYTSPAFLALEREELFRKQWICVGHVGEVARSGDYYATELVGEPLIVVRDAASRVRVLANVCRHRGSVVVQGRGHAQRFTCGYHAWTYGLDGHLISAPLMERQQAFDKARCGLPEYRNEIWQGFVFVNMDGQAEPLGPALAPIEPYIANYQQPERHFLHGADDVWATNWKCCAENFMEGYHLSPAHAKTLHAITPTSLCEKLPDGPAYTGYRANFQPSCPERGPYPPSLTEQERRSDVFWWIYPSFVVGVCPHFTLHMCLRPLGPDHVGIRWGITGVPGDPADPAVRDYVRLCGEFFAEDRERLELLQQGLGSRSYVPGPLAPDDFEGTVWDMYHYMARRLTGVGTIDEPSRP
jgi:phenylpropionate dioxygenase-like ring-hydroxylating dioxygenase large terminal subunit